MKGGQCRGGVGEKLLVHLFNIYTRPVRCFASMAGDLNNHETCTKEGKARWQTTYEKTTEFSGCIVSFFTVCDKLVCCTSLKRCFSLLSLLSLFLPHIPTLPTAGVYACMPQNQCGCQSLTDYSCSNQYLFQSVLI